MSLCKKTIVLLKIEFYNTLMSKVRIKSQTTNMTEGNPTGLLLRFAIPMLIGNLFQQLYNLVDSIIVGQYVGADALAAVGSTGSISFLFFALCNGLGNGGGIVTSQLFGTGDTKKIKSSISNTAYLMLFMAVVIGSISFLLSYPILKVMNTPSNIMKDSLIYLQIQCAGLIFVSLYNYASSMLRALGDSKTPLYFLIISCIVNTILDVVFVYNFKLGVMGAGIATVFSQLLSGISCLIFAIKTNEYFKLEREDFKYNKELILKAVKIGVPLSFQFSMIAISCMMLQRVVNGFGSIAVAAFTATSRTEQIIHMPYQTLGASLTTFCGQNYGAKKYDRVILGFKKSMIMMTIFSLAMLPVMQFGSEFIVKIFVNDPDVINMGSKALTITSYFYLFLGIIYMTRGILNGIGDALFSLVNGVTEVIGRLIFPIGFTMIPAMGLWGIWWSVGATWFISGFTAYLRYYSFKKKIMNNM